MLVSMRSETFVCPIQIDTELIGKVEQFQYLGSGATEDVRRATEIKRRIAIASPHK